MHSELARLVRGGRNDSTFIALPTYNNRLAFQRRVVQLLHRHEKRVHIDVEDRTRRRRMRGGHTKRNFTSGPDPGLSKTRVITVTEFLRTGLYICYTWR